MSIQKILPVQNLILRQKARPVTSFDRRIQRLVADLTETLLVQKNPLGVGLAASQVGKNIGVFVVKLGKNIIPFINPEIVWKSRETNDPAPPKAEIRNPLFDRKLAQSKQSEIPARRRFASSDAGGRNLTTKKSEYIMEGCLSLPHYYGPVRRAARIKVRYQSPITKVKTFSGLSAQIIQHEIDHLNGILFVDRLLEQKRKLYRWTGREWEEVELP